ncbi:MAG: response regulator [Burkholderiaceae bacterium]
MTSRIYLVEDHSNVRDTLHLALEELADVVVVGHASSQSAAIRWLRANPDAWDVVVLDLFLEEGSGFGVLKACAERQREQRLVVLSNYVDVSEATLREQGADAVFDKTTGLEAFFGYAGRELGRSIR